MSVELLQNLSLTAFVASGALLVAAIILFFALGIRDVIGDLSGRTARRAIEDIRQQSKNNERRSYESMRFRMDKGRITDKISTKRLLEQAESAGTAKAGAGTEVLSESGGMEHSQQGAGTEVLTYGAVTEVLQYDAATTVLQSGGATEVLQGAQTAQLGQDAGTVVLKQAEEQPVADFSVDVEIGFSESSEGIE